MLGSYFNQNNPRSSPKLQSSVTLAETTIFFPGRQPWFEIEISELGTGRKQSCHATQKDYIFWGKGPTWASQQPPAAIPSPQRPNTVARRPHPNLVPCWDPSKRPVPAVVSGAVKTNQKSIGIIVKMKTFSKLSRRAASHFWNKTFPFVVLNATLYEQKSHWCMHIHIRSTLNVQFGPKNNTMFRSQLLVRRLKWCFNPWSSSKVLLRAEPVLIL